MENCSVTKYKAAINNPNLPILVPLQQFTLDVITASGNDSMTVAQKLALDHFFYQIGAINNSGIYTKLKVLLLPFIATSVKTALNNYAKGSVYGNLSNYISFNNQGLVSSRDYTIVCSYPISGRPASDDIFFLTASESGYTDTRILNTDESTYTMDSLTGELNLLLNSNRHILRGGNFSMKNQINAIWLKKQDYLLLSANNSEIWQPETLNTDLSLLHKYEDIVSFKPIARTSDTLRAAVLGVGFTKNEATSFITAFKELYYSFISVSKLT